MRIIGTVLLLMGLLVGFLAVQMDTTVEAGGETIGTGAYAVTVPKTRIHNLGLMETRRMYFYGSGVALLLGAIFFGFGTLAQGGSRAPNLGVAALSSTDLLIRKFTEGRTLTSNEFREVVALTKLQPQLASTASRLSGETLLHFAARLGDPQAVQALLEAGAQREPRNGNGQTPLQVATNEDVRRILQGGA